MYLSSRTYRHYYECIEKAALASLEMSNCLIKFYLTKPIFWFLKTYNKLVGLCLTKLSGTIVA